VAITKVLTPVQEAVPSRLTLNSETNPALDGIEEESGVPTRSVSKTYEKSLSKRKATSKTVNLNNQMEVSFREICEVKSSKFECLVKYVRVVNS